MTLRAEANAVVRGAPINVHIEMQNTGNTPITVPAPFSVLEYSVNIQVTRGGRVVAPMWHWYGPGVNTHVELRPGESLQTEFDVGRLYIVTGLEPGEYVIRAVYQPSKEWLVPSNPIGLEVRALPKGEEPAYEAQLNVFKQHGDAQRIAALGREFLRKYPVSVFAYKVRLETALALERLKEYDESMKLYREAAEAKGAPRWVTETAAYHLARLLYNQGRKADAIAMIKQTHMDDSGALAERWQKELREEQQRETKKPAEEKK